MAEIVLRSVHHRYGDRTVLDGIDLTLTEQRIGIVGANGSGKSTLARMVNGLVLPTAGTVTVDGLDTTRQGKQVRQKVGFLFTDPDNQIIMPTVAEDIAFSLRRSGLSRSEIDGRVAASLAQFGLTGHADHPTHLLSGGQKQLLALAAVLIRRPEVLVADEPTTLLDLRNARLVADLLAALPQQVVVVTHHSAPAGRLRPGAADRGGTGGRRRIAGRHRSPVPGAAAMSEHRSEARVRSGANDAMSACAKSRRELSEHV